MSEHKTTGCDHRWFQISRYDPATRTHKPRDAQCGVCGAWRSDLAADLAARCDALGLPGAAAALREVADGAR
jgi:hypothetical protein